MVFLQIRFCSCETSRHFPADSFAGLSEVSKGRPLAAARLSASFQQRTEALTTGYS
jgi:hypothetical protein